jgi:hypothetical protein
MVGSARRCLFSREAVLGGADALPEQPHPILLFHANHLGFHAEKS